MITANICQMCDRPFATSTLDYKYTCDECVDWMAHQRQHNPNPVRIEGRLTVNLKELPREPHYIEV